MQRSLLLLAPGLLALAGCHELTPTEVAGSNPGPRFALIGGPVTPNFAGLVTSPILTIDNRNGMLRAARISPNGDLACYVDDGARQVRYHRFTTAFNAAIPVVADSYEIFCSADDARIAVIRGFSSSVALQPYVFDVATAFLTPIDPQPGAWRTETAIAGSTVAFVHGTAGGLFSEVRVADLAAPGSSHGIGSGMGYSAINISPDARVLVWQSLDLSGNLFPWKSERTGTGWGAPQPVGTAEGFQPVTDGTYIAFTAYDNDTGEDVFIQGVAGGPVQQIEMVGSEIAFSIDDGVVGILHTDAGVNNWNVFVYIIASNTLLQVTNTNFNENAPSVGVLANRNIRVVWQAGDIFATTFTPAGGPVGPPVGPAVAVQTLITQLSDPALRLTRGQINSLTGKLTNVLVSINAGLNGQAINQLNAAIAQINAAVQAGQMSAQTGAVLVAAIVAIIAMLT